jgi:hypothetical protein
MKSLLAVTNHDYLPNEFEPVCLDNDVYFELNDLKVTDGAPEIIKFKLYCYDHDVQHLQTFVDNCNTDYERRMANKLGAHRYYFDQMVQTKTKGSIQNPLPNTHLVYTKTKFVTTRTFENVFFEQRTQVRDRVKFFLEHRDWYEKKGIPYTLGFMFHGPPGTGKTSSIKAIANAGRRHIVNIQLSEVKTKQQLQHLFFNDELYVFNGVNTEKYTIPIAERLYVIEDIDAMGDVVLRREWKKPVIEEKKKEDEDLARDLIKTQEALIKREQALFEKGAKDFKDAQEEKIKAAEEANKQVAEASRKAAQKIAEQDAQAEKDFENKSKLGGGLLGATKGGQQALDTARKRRETQVRKEDFKTQEKFFNEMAGAENLKREKAGLPLVTAQSMREKVAAQQAAGEMPSLGEKIQAGMAGTDPSKLASMNALSKFEKERAFPKAGATETAAGPLGYEKSSLSQETLQAIMSLVDLMKSGTVVQ